MILMGMCKKIYGSDLDIENYNDNIENYNNNIDLQSSPISCINGVTHSW